jgi:glycosyltransferase involved in cell wall biosynthesis
MPPPNANPSPDQGSRAARVRATARAAARAAGFAIRQPKDFARALRRFADGLSTPPPPPPAGPATGQAPAQPQTALPYSPRVPHPMAHARPLHVRAHPDLADRPTLNLLLPVVGMGSMSGGPNTLLNIAARVAARANLPMRLVSTDHSPDADWNPIIEHVRALSGLGDRLPTITIDDAHDRAVPFHIGENDAFIVSAYWNAHMARAALAHTRAKRFLYTIQDFEPGLHAWGTEHALALNSYGFDHLPIVNTSLLADHLKAVKAGRFADPAFADDALIFEPAVDATRFHPPTPEDLTQSNGKRTLLFYARPLTAQRNLFEIGLKAIQIAAEHGVFADEPWDLLFIGEQLPEVPLAPGVSIKSSPWLGYDAYAALMRRCDVLLSLMLSPHPSYPPLEAAACGTRVVTNTYGTKTQARLDALSPHFLAVEPTPEAVADALIRAAQERRNSANPAHDKPSVALPLSWEDALEGVIDRAAAELLRLTTPDRPVVHAAPAPAAREHPAPAPQEPVGTRGEGPHR